MAPSAAAAGDAPSGRGRKRKPELSPAAAAARLAFAQERLQRSELPPGVAGLVGGSARIRLTLQRNVEVVISRFYKLEEALGSDLATTIVRRDPVVLRYCAETLLANRLELQRLLETEVSAAALDAAIIFHCGLLFDNKPAIVVAKLRKEAMETGMPVQQLLKDRRFVGFMLRFSLGTKYGRTEHLVTVLGCTAQEARKMVESFPALAAVADEQLKQRRDNAMALFHSNADGIARLSCSTPLLMSYTPDGLARRLSFAMRHCTSAVHDSGVQKWQEQLNGFTAHDKARLLRVSAAGFDRLRLASEVAPRLCHYSLSSVISMSNKDWNAWQAQHKAAKTASSQRARH